jgi:Mg-chelatase subunit ChlD
MKKTKTKEEMILSIKRMNKEARETFAQKAGFDTALEYIQALQGGVVKKISPLPQEEEKVVVHVVDLLDISGSMGQPYLESRLDIAVAAIKAGVAGLISEESVKYTHTFITFSSYQSQDVCHLMKDPTDVRLSTLRAMGGTALNDSIIFAIKKINGSKNRTDKVLLNIYTDGDENSSKLYSASAVSKAVEKFSELGFTITFIGTVKDTKDAIKNYGISASNTLAYDGSSAGLHKSMSVNNTMRASYASAVSRGEDVSTGFFKNIN